jgi:REP element-mobilizing transposase RayT
MRSQKQEYLPGFDGLKLKEFGGTAMRGNAREQRPIAIKRPMHLVMRSTLAVGERSFLNSKRARKIEALVHRLGKERGVKVYRFANSGNHLHLVVLPRSRQAFKSYIKAVTGIIARLSLGVERGSAKGIKFWDAKPYTRIIEWGREYRSVCNYLLQNTLEALGFIPYQSRKSNKSSKRKYEKSPYPR